MTTIQTNSELILPPRETTSYLQSFKHRLGIVPAPSTLLLEELNSQAPLSSDTLIKVVAFLADHPHTKLEQALKEKLAKTDPSKILANVKYVCTVSMQEDRLKMLEVCKRIVSLDQLKSGLSLFDPMAIAQRESSIIPAPTRTIEKISDTAIQNWHKYSSVFGKIIHRFRAVIMGTFLTLIASILSPFYSPPSNLMEVQRFAGIYEYIIKGYTYLTTSYLGFFATKKMASLVGIVIVISAIAINYIHERFRLGIPEQIDINEHFKNTSLEVQNGKIKKMKGRQAEREQVKTAWNVAPNEKFRIALLLGHTGCGKTEFVKGLAWESVNDPDSFVFGKRVFTINTIKLVTERKNYLEEVLESIAGHEDDIVLFFDEGHSAGNEKGKIGPLIETLKTTLLDKNIRTILATTQKEFKDNIEHNEAFVDRCINIDFKELPDVESKKILKDKVELDVDRVIEVDADAYDALLKVAASNPNRANPRKVIDLHKDVRSYVYGWEPKNLSQQLDQLTVEKDNLYTNCKENNNNPDWSNSPKGIESFTKLTIKADEIQELIEKLKTQKSDLNRIARLRKLGPQYRKQYNGVIHQLVAEKTPKEELLKEFLYLKHVLRPALQTTLESEAEKLTELYKEELPLKIDAALIKKLYPAAFNSPKDSASNSPRSETSPQEIAKTSSTEI